jgi:ubiquinone/menaquinone biosynthesis C-methylase UbiE
MAAAPTAPPASAERIKDVNTRYHDAAAGEYDAKWGIDLGEVGQRQVRSKIEKALGKWPQTFGDALEIGAGTGYFTLNLAQLGLIERATATDISPGMLEALDGSAKELGIDVRTVECEAEELPFPDESFDLVFGHAVLHHIPDLHRAFGEFERVLRPGGTLVFCGEPSRYGDSIAAVPKRAAIAVSPLWRALIGAGERRRHPESNGCGGDHGLEWEVDVHAFSPRDLGEMLRGRGFETVRIRGEELLANMYGWVLRSLESTAEPDRVPMRWRNFAFNSYLALQRVDSSLLEPRLPPALFYNLVLSALKPG